MLTLCRRQQTHDFQLQMQHDARERKAGCEVLKIPFKCFAKSKNGDVTCGIHGRWRTLRVQRAALQLLQLQRGPPTLLQLPSPSPVIDTRQHEQNPNREEDRRLFCQHQQVQHIQWTMWLVITIIIIKKRQFIRRSNIASHYKGAVQCSLLVLKKRLVSEVGTWEQMCLEHVFKSW